MGLRRRELRLSSGIRRLGVASGLNALNGVAPSAPTGLAAAGTGLTTIALTWNAVSGATSYKVYRGASSGSETLLASGVGTTSYTATGLTAGTVYYFKVSAVNSAGEGSLSSETNGNTLVAQSQTFNGDQNGTTFSLSGKLSVVANCTGVGGTGANGAAGTGGTGGGGAGWAQTAITGIANLKIFSGATPFTPGDGTTGTAVTDALDTGIPLCLAISGSSGDNGGVGGGSGGSYGGTNIGDTTHVGGNGTVGDIGISGNGGSVATISGNGSEGLGGQGSVGLAPAVAGADYGNGGGGGDGALNNGAAGGAPKTIITWVA